MLVLSPLPGPPWRDSHLGCPPPSVLRLKLVDGAYRAGCRRPFWSIEGWQRLVPGPEGISLPMQLNVPDDCERVSGRGMVESHWLYKIEIGRAEVSKPGPGPTEFHLQPSNKIGITHPRPTQRAPDYPTIGLIVFAPIVGRDGRKVADNEPAYVKAGVGEPSLRRNLSRRRARTPQARAGRRLPRGFSDRAAVIGRRHHLNGREQPVTWRRVAATSGRRDRGCGKSGQTRSQSSRTGCTRPLP